MNNKEEDKRAHSRINANLSSRIVFPLRHYAKEGVISNISEGGLCFKADSINGELINDPVKLDFVLDNQRQTSVVIEGRIVYITDDKIGVKFRYVDKVTEEELRRYVG
jgi:hypothetical protein